MLETLIPFLSVFFAEFGDKTQLLILLLVIRFKKKTPIFLGMLTGLFFNHLPAAYLGHTLAEFIPMTYLPFMMGGLFLLMGLLILFDAYKSHLEDKQKNKNLDESSESTEDEKVISKWANKGPFIATAVLFFISEMGDKTQFAVMFLSVQFSNILMVVLGTVSVVALANLIPLFFGPLIAKKIPENVLRIIAGLIFVLLALYTLIFE